LVLRLEPCVGRPHLKASVYGCPSAGGRVVWEYMSEKMKGDIIAQGKELPEKWQWVGDAESLIIDITHRTYYIEVGHYVDGETYMPTYDSVDGQTSYAKYLLEAHILDNAKQPLESANPLKNLCGWDRQVRVRDREIPQTSIFGGFTVSLSDNSTKTEVEWYAPGEGGSTGVENCSVSQDGPYSYQVYVKEITDFVGTSGVDYDLNAAKGVQDSWTYPAGDFVDVIKPPVCPAVSASGEGECTRTTCRVCPIQYPDCPKEFLTNCTEVAVNLAKVKAVLNGTTRPLESFLKEEQRYTMWTSCGLVETSGRITSDRTLQVRPPARDGGWAAIPPEINQGMGPEGKWWEERELNRDVNTGRWYLRLEGLREDRNNVYIINVVAKHIASGETAAYTMLALQLKTAKYKPPELGPSDVALLSSIGGLVLALILIFCLTALFVQRKRLARRATRVRDKR